MSTALMENQTENRIAQLIKMSEIFSDDQFNCRGAINAGDVVDLSKSIKLHGLLEPITIQPYDKHLPYKYRIVVGHRRFLAMKVSGEHYIHAFVKEGLDALDAHTLNIIENIKRKDLNILQEAFALRAYKSARYTIEETANTLSMSKGWVQVRYVLLTLPEEIQQEAAAGFLNQEHIKALANIGTKEEQFAKVKQIKEARFKGEEVPKIKKKKKNPLKKIKKDVAAVNSLLEHLLDTIGPGIHTRLLAWVNGAVNDVDIHRDLNDYAKVLGKSYTYPEEIRPFIRD